MNDKKILILGAAGMLGHKLCQLYKDKYNLVYTVRSNFEKYKKFEIFEKEKMIEGVDVLDFNKTAGVIKEIDPDVLINCVGIIKQLKEASDPILSIKINSLLPHQLANVCQEIKARFFHISTDCVFNGQKGMYTEQDPSNAEDLYGRTKFLGEVHREGCLTLRTSIIGRELATASGLVEWFLNNRGSSVKGFGKAVYSGFTTIALARIISDIIQNHPDLSGLYQVSSEPIDKYSLLCMINEAFHSNIEIAEDTDFILDRSMNSARFRSETGFTPPSWEQMIKEMAEDKTPYDLWKTDS